MYIKRSGIDDKVRREKELRKQQRRAVDQLTGVAKIKGAARQDYKLCRENDKLLAEYRRFRDRNDRNKISAYMEQARREYGRKG